MTDKMDKPFEKLSPAHCLLSLLITSTGLIKSVFKEENRLQNPVWADLPYCVLSTSHAILHPF